MRLFDVKKKLGLEDVERVEQYFNITLPKDYKEKILSFNGKSYANAYILHPKYKELDFSDFISLRQKDKRNIYALYKNVIENPRYFPFADTDFGDYYCFDLKKNQIVLWLHETEKAIPICASFTDF